MANTNAVLLLSFLTTLSISFPSSTATTIAKSNGLTIKLIHRDSPDSPFYQPNLTTSQRTRKLILQSEARALRYHHPLQYPKQHFSSNALRPKVDYQGPSVYMAQVGIGTFTSGPIYYFLGMDSSIDLIWTQCDNCRSPGHHCFPQRQPLFPSLRSSSYRKLVCNRHPLCYPRSCIGNFCSYISRFADNSTSTGFLSSETFTFDSDSSRKEVVPNIVFGCGFDQVLSVDFGQEGNYAGILGLGWGPHSLVTQLGSRAGGRFSYCLQTMTNPGGRNTLLRFGSDIPNRPGLQSTDLLQYGGQLSGFYVSLLDISIAGARLRIPPDHFARKPSGGGTVMDSGSAFSSLIRPAYDILERELIRYFLRFPTLTRIRPPRFFKLCYERIERRGYTNLPSLTFHFRGADLVVQPQGAFYVKEAAGAREYFCLAMTPFDGATLIGAYQQTNQRFIYDLNTKKLFFGREDCLRNA
ncbi:aspartic proteinase CDR1 [Ziziphus jujuba]|uniref:Aspartic proteinase CDR1 n=1 Tax=Ziziphus jujuba TaxID=326968 RepID=A0A6P6G3K0_ZIZJJ|nr:aspartic proteinase CDR1 [Ziziphus jujuba]